MTELKEYEVNFLNQITKLIELHTESLELLKYLKLSISVEVYLVAAN